MNYEEKYHEFTESLKANGKRSMYKQANAFSAIGKYDYTDCEKELIEQVVLACKPQKGYKSVSPIIQMIVYFAQFIGDKHLEETAHSVNRKKIWGEAEKTASKRYISHKEFMEVIRKILTYTDDETNLLNTEYYAALFWCIYEGVYNSDYSLLINMRTSNIDKKTITIYDNDEAEYKFVFPKKLINLLITIGEQNVWETTNATIPIKGKYQDSCFKISQRVVKGKNGNRVRVYNSYWVAYRHRYRTIVNTYIKRKLLPQELYVSGIMHRIILRAKKENIDWREIFKENNRDTKQNLIILQELKHSHYDVSIKRFREMVRDYLYVFDE